MSINKKIIPFLLVVHAYLCHVKARGKTNLTNKRVLIIFSKTCRCPVGIGPRQRNRARPYSHFELQKEIGRRSPDCGRLFFAALTLPIAALTFPIAAPTRIGTHQRLPIQMNSIPSKMRKRSKALALRFFSWKSIAPKRKDTTTEPRRISDITEIIADGSFRAVR